MHGLLAELGLILTAAVATYAVLAALATVIAAARSRRAAPDSGGVRPAVSVLKPLCGSEAELYERLCALCAQDYRPFQVVFGVQNPADGALPVARRVQQQFGALDIECVIDTTRHGVNAKVSNLLNMLPLAKHDLLIIADSDIEVPRDYLQRVVAPLADPRVGLVTCGYLGRAGPGLWSALGAQFINAWFMPSVYFAAMFGSQWFVSGATIALRREVLTRCGGLGSLADQLADDFQLGAQMRALVCASCCPTCVSRRWSTSRAWRRCAGTRCAGCAPSKPYGRGPTPAVLSPSACRWPFWARHWPASSPRC